MYKKIIELIKQNASIDQLYEILVNIPQLQIEDVIRKIDSELKDLLYQQSNIIHSSMESYHNVGDVNIIRKQFKMIETYLKRLVYLNLPIYQRWYISILNFFVSPYTNEEMEDCISTIKDCQDHIMIYNSVLDLKSQKFLKYIAFYQSWIVVLSKFVSNIPNIYDTNPTEIQYSVQKTLYNASEFLTTQRQLESTIKLQMQNNQIIMNDALHITTISRSLVQNTLSIENFFHQEYIGGLEIIKKYTKPLSHGVTLSGFFRQKNLGSFPKVFTY